jgi:FtsZ-interacting cell division protein ZipA
MSVGAVIAIVIGAIIIVALLGLVSRRQRVRRLAQRRVERDQHRDEARIRGARAERERATADEQAAAARRQAAEAEERSVRARQEAAVAEQHEARAREIDPDRDSTPEESRDNHEVAATRDPT